MCSPVPVTSPGSKCTREWHRWSRWGVGWKVGMSLVTFIEYYIYILPPKQTWSQGPWKRVYSIVLGVFGLCPTLHGFWWKMVWSPCRQRFFFFYLAPGQWGLMLACCGSQTCPGFCLIREWNLPSKNADQAIFCCKQPCWSIFFEGGLIICGNGWALGIGKTEPSCPQLRSNQRSWQESLQQIFNEIDDSNANQVGVMFHQ